MSSTPKSNYNAAIILNVAGGKAIAKDPNFGQKVYEALQGSMMGSDEDRVITCTTAHGEVPVGRVIATHQADQVRLVATGDNTGVDLGAAGGVENLKPENARALFEAGLEKFDLVVRQEAVRRTPEQKAADEKAEAERKAKRASQEAGAGSTGERVLADGTKA